MNEPELDISEFFQMSKKFFLYVNKFGFQFM